MLSHTVTPFPPASPSAFIPTANYETFTCDEIEKAKKFVLSLTPPVVISTFLMMKFFEKKNFEEVGLR